MASQEGYLITLDVGTTAVKGGVYNCDLEPIAFVVEEYTLITPQKGYVELDAATYWNCAYKVIRTLLSNPSVQKDNVLSVTCTTQGETLIPIDKEGVPLHNAVVWLDSRATQQAERIKEQFDDLLFYQKTGIPGINGYCPIAKLLWFKEERTEVYEKAHKFLLLEDYLVFKLCGELVTNPGLVCSTGYYDIFGYTYWHGILDYCGIDNKKLPDVRPCGTVVGQIKPEAAKALGLPGHVKVTTGAMDQVASAIGSGNIKEGIVGETTGTCQVVAATSSDGPPAEFSPVTIYNHALPGKYLKLVLCQTAGIIYKWFRNEFCQDLSIGEGDAFKAMDELAAKEPPLSRGLMLYPHLTGMQAPNSDPSIRGVFFGVGLDTGRGCFIRSILEGVGYMLRESMSALEVSTRRIISLGGGAKSKLWCQIKADICGSEIAALNNEESSSLGAAMLGAVAIGLCDNLENLSKNIADTGKVYYPDAENHALYSKAYDTYLSMYDSFANLFNKNNR